MGHFPIWVFKCAVMLDFPALFKSEFWSTFTFGIYPLLFFFSFSFFLSAAMGTPKHRCAKAQVRQSAAKRSHSTSEVGAEAGRAPYPKGGGQEELPHVRGQGQRPRVPDCDSAGTADRSYPTSEVRGDG